MIILDYMTLIRIQTSDWNSCMLVFVCVCCLPEALGVHAHQIYQVCQPHPGRRAGRDIVVSICQALNIWKRLNIKPNWQKLLTSLPGFPGGPDGPRGPRGPYSKTIVINWFNWPSKAVAMFFWMCHLCVGHVICGYCMCVYVGKVWDTHSRAGFTSLSRVALETLWALEGKQMTVRA